MGQDPICAFNHTVYAISHCVNSTTNSTGPCVFVEDYTFYLFVKELWINEHFFNTLIATLILTFYAVRPRWISVFFAAGIFALFPSVVYEILEELTFFLNRAGFNVIALKHEYDAGDAILWDPLSHIGGSVQGIVMFFIFLPFSFISVRYVKYTFKNYWKSSSWKWKQALIFFGYYIVFPIALSIIPNQFIKILQNAIDHCATYRWDYLIVTLVRLAIMGVVFCIHYFLDYDRVYSMFYYKPRGKGKLVKDKALKRILNKEYARFWLPPVAVIVVVSFIQFFQVIAPIILLFWTWVALFGASLIVLILKAAFKWRIFGPSVNEERLINEERRKNFQLIQKGEKSLL